MWISGLVERSVVTTSWVCMLSWFDIVCSILATVERESNVLEKELEPEFCIYNEGGYAWVGAVVS